MTMSRKAPPQKKRHTKPCKFFQVNRCPNPADVCNFAHVTQDALCGYSYEPRDIPLTAADSLLRVDTKNLGQAYLYGDVRLIPDATPFIRHPPLSLPQQMAAESPLFTPSPGSNTTGSTSMSTSDLDEMAIVTDDPQYHEHLHSYQSQVYVEDNSPVIHVPPFSPLFKPRSSTRSSTKQKILKYKTKPCKFFPTERGCPKGSLCSFVHERHQISSPVKESNVKEENCRKNYFPVPWRVIGGGVRVGIAETEDSDLYSANTSRPVNPTSKLENDTPTKVVSRRRSNSNPPTPSPHSLQFKVEHLFSAESPGVL